MLTYNTNAGDGLANGACEESKEIIFKNDRVDAVLVAFDNPDVGKEARRSSSFRAQWPDAVPMPRITGCFPLGKRKGRAPPVPSTDLLWADNSQGARENCGSSRCGHDASSKQDKYTWPSVEPER